MSPDDFVHPWIGQNVALEVDIHTLPDRTAVEVAPQVQGHQWRICEQKAIVQIVALEVVALSSLTLRRTLHQRLWGRMWGEATRTLIA